MAARRWRRASRPQALLPLYTRRLSHTLSCWYCDFKISAFNGILYSFGRKYSRCFQVWFSMGVGFSLFVLITATMILLWESAGALSLYYGDGALRNLSNGLLFGVSPPIPGLLWITDAGYMIFSTLISVAVHEFGHAVAAASEGIHIEYVAIFLAIIFPGALVAFNYDLMENLPRMSSLRIYCAGIWHNAVFCAACGLTLVLLPVILSPLYVHSEHPMVLSVSPSSPLSGYLSDGDIIVSLDGLPIHDPQDWTGKLNLLDDQTFQESKSSRELPSLNEANGRKGYCVPRSLIEESMKIEPADGFFVCPDELTSFRSAPCLNLSLLDDSSSNIIHNKTESANCLLAMAVVKLKKCGDGWQITRMNGSSCPCSQDEECLVPIQMPGSTWVEISFSRPYSLECLQQGGNHSLDIQDPDFGSDNCGGTFVYVGDVVSAAYSIQLSSYRPQWVFSLSTFPNVLEKMLAYTFHVSATLALLNSLPVFFLDGESILEVCLCYVTWLGPRRRQKVLRICLLCGSLLSILTFSWIFFSIVAGQL